VVPFFGDQFLRGRIVADAGAGPEPITIDRLDSEALRAAIDICWRPQVRLRARELGAKLPMSDGVDPGRRRREAAARGSASVTKTGPRAPTKEGPVCKRQR
jgi:hypothetical protein